MSAVEQEGYELEQFGNAPAPLPDPERPPLRIVSLTDFIAVEEETAEPLFGPDDQAILPANGTLLMYGDGGAGKTTLAIDAIAHLCSGETWLEHTCPRPLRALIVENEGPRGEFRRMLLQKVNDWTGPAFLPNVDVLEEPWTHINLADQTHRNFLAGHITKRDVDMLLMGPIATIGMRGGGTPDEISAFERMLRDLRDIALRDFGIWLLHHENKAGDVSGAFERMPDTLCHVQAQGNGHTRIHWRKVRWASSVHGTSQRLLWAPGRTFTVQDERQRDVKEDVIAYLEMLQDWATANVIAEELALGKERVRVSCKQLTKEKILETETGPEGHRSNSICYRIAGAGWEAPF